MVECSFFIKNYCYIFSNANRIEKTRHFLTRFFMFVNFITRSTCCNARLNIMMKRQKYSMANISNFREVFHRYGSSRKQKQQPLEAETLNFRVLMNCSNQQNLNMLREAIWLSVHKRKFLVIIDKIFWLTRNFLKALVIVARFFLLFLLLFLLIVYVSLAFHLEVFRSELFCISIV